MIALTVHLALDSTAATHALGCRLGAVAAAGQIIGLSGDLGAGKTTLTQGIAAGLGLADRITSPTFTLVNEYDAGARHLRLVHIDVYRLGETTAAALAAVAGIGLDEILDDAGLPGRADEGAVVVIEWAERIHAALPADYLHIMLETDPHDTEARHAELTAYGAQSSTLLRGVTAESSTVA